MSTDKKTIGLTSENRTIIEELVEQKLFKGQIDAAKFAMSLAIKSGIPPGAADRAETIWNVGSFDPDGKVKTLILNLFPGIETPYRVAEHFVNGGLQIIATRFPVKRSIADLMNLMRGEGVMTRIAVE